MYIKQLIKDEQSYWEFVWPFIERSSNPNLSLWREEDLPKLQPFFNAQGRSRSGDKMEWTPEVKESFDYYQKCREEYGDKNTEVRDAVSQFSPEEVLDAFGYQVPEYDDSDDDGVDYVKDKPLPLDKDFDVTFPFVVVGEISSGFDRLGNIKIFAVHFVSLKDFCS